MTDEVTLLKEKDFEAVTTDLPGEWSSDGDWTVAVQTRPIHGGPLNDHCHHVLVYEARPWDIAIGTELAARKTAMSNESAIRSALDEAGYPIDDGR